MGITYHILQARAAINKALALAVESETKAILRLQRAELDLLLEKLQPKTNTEAIA